MNDDTDEKREFERLRTKQRLEMLLHGSDETLLYAVLASAIRFGAFASFLDDATKKRMLNEAADYKDFYLHKAIQDAIRKRGDLERVERTSS